jgi:hypothetical protein
MSRRFPSMTALLGLLAIAGYQNRDKIAEMLSGLGQKKPGTEAGDRPRGVRHFIDAHRSIAGRITHEALPRTSRCSG